MAALGFCYCCIKFFSKRCPTYSCRLPYLACACIKPEAKEEVASTLQRCKMKPGSAIVKTTQRSNRKKVTLLILLYLINFNYFKNVSVLNIVRKYIHCTMACKLKNISTKSFFLFTGTGTLHHFITFFARISISF
jgi:hypothetical protein